MPTRLPHLKAEPADLAPLALVCGIERMIRGAVRAVPGLVAIGDSL